MLNNDPDKSHIFINTEIEITVTREDLLKDLIEQTGDEIIIPDTSANDN